jgi:hypothetical protein
LRRSGYKSPHGGDFSAYIANMKNAIPTPRIKAGAAAIVAARIRRAACSRRTTSPLMRKRPTSKTASAEARAVSNTASFDVAAPPAELVGVDPSGGYVTNAILGADLTQLSIGDGHANAVASVRFEMTGNLGSLDRPLASATATAIGNLGSAVVRTGSLDLIN